MIVAPASHNMHQSLNYRNTWFWRFVGFQRIEEGAAEIEGVL
jgi:hypothetical protein